MDISVGTWIDNRTNIGKRGKFRPFILWSAIPLALLLIANFTMPNFSVTGQLVWAYVAYMLFGTCYSISNIPFGSMIPTMTKNSQERSELASYRQAGSNLGLMVATIGFMPIVTSLPNEKKLVIRLPYLFLRYLASCVNGIHMPISKKCTRYQSKKKN